jgi:hypothetical protein
VSKYGRENRRRANKESARDGEVFLPWVAPQGQTTEIISTLHLGGFLYAQREIRLESNGMLVEFAIVVSKDTPKGRREILCIDNCHRNNVHKHLNNHKEYAVLKELLFEGDLDVAFLKAIDEATNLCSDQIGGNDD